MGETVTEQMNKILDDYKNEVRDVTNDSISKVSKESVQKLKNGSPRKSGDYSKGWRAKKVAKNSSGIDDVVVHNATDYQLTHLLENGHVIRNKKGEFGRAPAHPHIKPVEEWANSELPEEIERELK